MKKLIFLAVLCLLASASQINAQLIIRNSGHNPCHYKTVL